MAESDTQEEKKNLENTQEVFKEFEKEYHQDMEDMARQEHKERMFRRGELLGRFMARKLFGQSDKKYDKEYWGRLERNWRWQKGKQLGREKMEIVTEEEKIKEENLGIREGTEENNNEMGNMVDPYYELQGKFPQDEEA